MASNKRLQYQVIAGPVPIVTVAPTIPEDSWHQSWSEPVKQKILPALAIALITSGLLAPTPVAPTFPAITETSATSSQIIYKNRLIYQTSAEPVFVAEQITVDKWFSPFRDPVRIKVGLGAAHNQLASVIGAPPIINFGYYNGLSEPVRQKIGLRANLQQTVAGPVLDSTLEPGSSYESSWHYPWSEPVRAKRGLPAYEQQSLALTQVAETITYDKWGYAWSEPVRTKRGLLASQQPVTAQTVFPVEAINVDKWFKPFNEPVRIKLGIHASLQQAFIAPVLNPDTQITQGYESRWHYAWSEPQRQKLGLSAQLQQAFVYTTFIPPTEIITVDKWIYAWSDPVRTNRITTALQAPVTTYFQTPPAFPTVNAFTSAISSQVIFKQRTIYQSEAQPPRIEPQIFTQPSNTSTAWPDVISKRRLIYQSRAQPLPVELITLDKWYEPWADPVRTKIGLASRLQQALIQPQPIIEVATVDKWTYPWSEPVRFKKLITSLQSSFTMAPAPIPVVQQVISSAQSSPIFFKQRFIYQSEIQILRQLVEVVTVDKWFKPLGEPSVLTKRGLGASLQQAFIAPVLNPETQIIQKYESRWHQPWSEPSVKTKRGLAAQHQQAFTGDTLVIPVSKTPAWLYAWSEPVRKKLGLPAPEQQFLAFVSPVPEIVTADKWEYPWSEPVRKKLGLGAWLQQAAILDVPPEPNFLRQTQWFSPLAEPVRLKLGLLTALQDWWSIPPGSFIVPNVFITLSATEVNTDSALFGIVTYNPAVSASVSIKEIPIIRTAAASIEEQAAIDRGAVSIEEEPAVDAAAASIKEV